MVKAKGYAGIVFLLATIFLWLALTIPVYADTNRVEMPGSGLDPLGGKDSPSVWCRLGQRLTIPGRLVTEMGYQVCRVGNPTGNVTISMRDAETDEVIVSKVWGDASELPESWTGGYRKVALDTPLRINQEVRICVEYYGGNATDYCVAAYYTGDRITGEWYTNYYHYGVWHDIGEAEEGAYCYTYVGEDGGQGDPDGAHTNWWPLIFTIVGGILGLVFLIRYFVIRKKSKPLS